MIIRRGLLLVLCCGALASAPAPAQESPENAAKAQAELLLQRFARAGTLVDEARQRLLGSYEAQDLDGGGVGESDRVLGAKVAAAQQRAKRLTELLRHDLDGDGAVTETELRQALLPQARRPLRASEGEFLPTPDQIAQTLDKLVSRLRLSDSDLDGDGKATAAEILAAAETAQPQGRTSPLFGSLNAGFDVNGDGTIIREEFTTALDAAIAGVDRDGDGTFSDAEVTVFRERLAAEHKERQRQEWAARQRDQLRARLEACPLPPAPAGAMVLFLGLKGGQAVSNATFGAPDKVSFLIDVIIAPDAPPIYLMTTSRAQAVLRFSGATERLVRVINLNKTALGFVGIDRARAGWFEERPCFISDGAVWRRGGKQGSERPYLDGLAGRPVDKVLEIEHAAVIALPSGDFTRRPRGERPTHVEQAPSNSRFKRPPTTDPDKAPPAPSLIPLDQVIARDPVIAYRYGG